MQRVIEKLKTENESIKSIVDQLIKQCEVEPGFIDKILNEKKSLEECWTYIKIKARKFAKDGVAAILKETVYGWAIHYFDEEELEELKKREVIKKPKSKISKPKNAKDTENNQFEEDIEEFKPIEKKMVKSTIKRPKGVSENQISLFDL